MNNEELTKKITRLEKENEHLLKMVEDLNSKNNILEYENNAIKSIDSEDVQNLLSDSEKLHIHNHFENELI